MFVLLMACSANAEPQDTGAPSWDEVSVVLETHCVRCHTHRESMYGGVELDTWEAASAAREKNTCTAVSPDKARGINCSDWAPLSMPPGAALRLSSDEQDLLVAWTVAGGPR